MLVPVTTLLRIRPQAAQEAACLQWMQETALVAAQFPGYQGRELLRDLEDGALLVNIFRFDSPATLAAWEASPERAAQVALGRAYVAEIVAKTQLSGLEYILPAPAPPVRWKLVLLTVAVIFALLNTLVPGLQSLFDLLGLPPLLKSLLGVAVMVSLMTYVVMPLLGRWLGTWLRRA